MYLLIEGRIQLYKNSPDGKEVVIKVVQPGEVFAEVVLFEERTYPVSAAALNTSRVMMLLRHQIMALLAEQAFRDDFIGFLMKKQRYLTERIYYLTTHDVEDRFFRFLVEQYGQRAEYTVGLSKRDIAAAIGATPESLSRLIQRLKKEQGITWTGNVVCLPEAFWNSRAD